MVYVYHSVPKSLTRSGTLQIAAALFCLLAPDGRGLESLTSLFYSQSW